MCYRANFSSPSTRPLEVFFFCFVFLKKLRDRKKKQKEEEEKKRKRRGTAIAITERGSERILEEREEDKWR